MTSKKPRRKPRSASVTDLPLWVSQRSGTCPSAPGSTRMKFLKARGTFFAEGTDYEHREALTQAWFLPLVVPTCLSTIPAGLQCIYGQVGGEHFD